jgi:hypothetical protein
VGMMNQKNLQKLFLAIIFALIPIISFVLSYHYSVESNTLHEFQTNYAPYYLDFLFIIFNVLILYAVRLNYKLFGAIFISSLLVLGLINYIYWTFQPGMGIVHLIFAAIEISLLITAIFSKATNKKTYLIMMIPVLLYFSAAFIIELFIYKPVVVLEVTPHLIGLIVVSLRLIMPKLFGV